MDQILRHFRAEPFWFAFKTVSAAIGVICLQQTGFISSALVPYTGSFQPHTPPKPPPTPASLVVKMNVDPLRPHPDFGNVDGISVILNDTSNVVAYEQANVSGTVVKIMVTANSSTHCFPVNGTTTKAASTTSLPSRTMTWLISTGTDLLQFILRRMADLAFLHNTSMSTASMACLAVPLTIIAAFVGYQGYLGVQHVRQIYTTNAELASREREREVQLVHLDEAVSLNLNKVALLEGRATRAEEAKERLQQQYAEALRLKGEEILLLLLIVYIANDGVDASDKEAEMARDEAGDARNALEDVTKSLATAREEAHKAKEEAKKRVSGMNDGVSEQRNTINSLRRDKSILQRDLEHERVEAAAVAEKFKKSLPQKEAENLKKELRDRLELLKSQGKNTIALQKSLSSLKEQVQNLKPEALDKLRKQITDEQQLHKEAVDKATSLEDEMTRNGEAEKRRMSAAVENQNDLKKQFEEATRRLEKAEHTVTLLDAEKARQADVEAHITKDLTTRVEAAVKGQKIAEDKNRLLETKMAQQTETECEVKRKLMMQVEEGVKIQNAAEEKTEALETEMGQVKQQLKTQVEEAVNHQKAAEEKSALLQAEMAQQAEAGADATRQIQEKLDASTRLLVELKGEMEDLDTNYHRSVARFEEVRAAKDATIKQLQAQLGDLISNSSWTDDDASTSPQGMDEPPPRPAVRLLASGSDAATTENADTDNRDAGFSIKGAAGRQDSDESNGSGAGNDTSSGSPANFEGSGGEDTVNDGHRDLSQGSSLVTNVCFCDNCGRKHAPPCKYFGPPYCANCGKNHPGKLNSCKKWCKQCQASHYRSDCPHTKTASHTSSQAPTGSAAVDDSNDLGDPSDPSPAAPTDEGSQSPARGSATTPVPAIDDSRTPGSQRGGHGSHRWTAPGRGRVRPPQGGFVPMPAAQRHGPSTGRGGRGRPGQGAPLTAAESFERQQRARDN